jgi:hypothetical protein
MYRLLDVSGRRGWDARVVAAASNSAHASFYQVSPGWTPGHGVVGQIPSSDTSFRKVAVTFRN